MTKGNIINFKDNFYREFKVLTSATHHNIREDRRLLIPFTNGEKIGFVDKDNRVVVPLAYSMYYGECYGGEDFVVVEKPAPEGKKGNRWGTLQGVINSKGEEILSCEYLHIYPSIRGKRRLFTVVLQNGEHAVITSKKDIIVPSNKYFIIGGFRNGFARVRAGKITNGVTHTDAKWGIIDEEGKEILPLEYNDIWDFYKGDWDAARLAKDGHQYNFFFKYRELIPFDLPH